jgi:hypothetical protein
MSRIRLIAFTLLAATVCGTASASVVRPCREPLEGVRRLGDEKWIETCAANRGPANTASVRQCREWLAACRKNPQHPLPAVINNL